MSYRTVKRLLGETSLERKCRYLFGGGLVLLIAGSFGFYYWQTKDLVYEQNRTTARSLIAPILLEKHWLWSEPNDEFRPMIEELAGELKPKELGGYSYTLSKADPKTADAAHRPIDERGYKALEELKQDEDRNEVIERLEQQGKYHYYRKVRASRSCLNCHYHSDDDNVNKEGDMIGMVRVTLPLERTTKALHKNQAVLLATAFVTVFLAMLAAYGIVRYVIVKPVLHLKDVSHRITRGQLDLRADIRTGDEFEELSHAFNRMLRYLVTAQEELRAVNTDLDGKVDELAQVNLKLYEMNKLKDEFLGTMSHELRTPLNSILGFSDVLANADNLSDKQKRYVRNILASGEELKALINDLLDLAKIESGKTDLKPVEFSVGELIEQQVNALAPMAEQKNIDLSSEIGADLPMVVQDSGKLQQVLNNLLSNAVKFTPEGGRVRVRAGMHDRDTMELIVADTGIGIPLEEQATIFEKFRQGRTDPKQEDALTREYGGTGLGLSIVKELTKLLGGEVLLDSEFGKGSTFTVRLPVRLEPPEEPEESWEDMLKRQAVGNGRKAGRHQESETEPSEAESASTSTDASPPGASSDGTAA